MITDDDIKIELASVDEIRDIAMAIRKQVFVEELSIPENDDLDDNDGPAAHIIAYIQKQDHKFPVGTMRIRFFGGFVKFERMAVLRNFRKTNVSENIMQYAYNYVAIKGFRHVSGMCKEELLPRWQRSGYYVNEKAPITEQNGMKLISICRDLPPHPRALTMNSDPKLLIAQEKDLCKDFPNIQKNPKMKKTPEVQKPTETNRLLMKIRKFKQKLFNY